MAKTIQEDFLYKKAYEFSYAALMIASSAKNKDIASLMESKAILLLDSVLIADYAKTKDIVYSIISLAGIMVDGGLLHPINREVLIKESENIYSAIDALPALPKRNNLPDLNLNKIFSKSNFPINPHTKRQISDKQTKTQVQSEISKGESEIANKTIADIRPERSSAPRDEISDKSYDESSSFKSEVRQSAIINKLQQIGNCRLNELQELFPDVSDRTLRYDIEALISKGLVERIGSRRNSVYQPKNRTDAVIELPSPSAQNQ